MEYSQYQLAAFDYWKKHLGSSSLISVAGSGKTFTIIEGIQYIPRFYNVLLTAFNKDIKLDFEAKGKEKGYKHVKYSTFNSFGAGICYRANRNLQFDEDKTVNILRNEVISAYKTDSNNRLFDKFKYTIQRIVSLFKNLNIHTVAQAINEYEAVLDWFDIDVPDDEHFYGCLFETFERCIGNPNVLDYDDQKYMPLHMGWHIPKFDNVIVDEFQDICQVEYELLNKAAEGGIFIAVGDPDQSIYSFKGSTPDSFTKYTKGMKELFLSICYRCPKKIVEEAKKIVPRIEWAPDAKEGTIDTVQKEYFHARTGPGDFVICRVNEHLIKECLVDIENGKNARVRGRDFGNKVIYLVDKVTDCNKYYKVEDLVQKLTEYRASQYEWLQKINKERSIIQLDDKISSVKVLIKNCQTVEDLKKKIDKVFIGDKEKLINGIDYMSIHKSKGLQAKNVWWLRKDLMPHPRAKTEHHKQEEKRLEYVGDTRTTDSLFFVQKDKDEK